MRPLTTKQHELLNEICNNVNDFKMFGHENQRDVGELRKWNRFDSDIIEEVEKKFANIAQIGEEISSLICIIKDIRNQGRPDNKKNQLIFVELGVLNIQYP